MEFNNPHVDINDVHQILSNSRYYLSCNNDVKFASLIYPSTKDNPFINNNSQRFGFSYLKVSKDIIN